MSRELGKVYPISGESAKTVDGDPIYLGVWHQAERYPSGHIFVNEGRWRSVNPETVNFVLDSVSA